MAEYLVTWTIEVDADSPREAAQIAYQYQKQGSLATVFTVHGHDAPRSRDRPERAQVRCLRHIRRRDRMVVR